MYSTLNNFGGTGEVVYNGAAFWLCGQYRAPRMESQFLEQGRLPVVTG